MKLLIAEDEMLAREGIRQLIPPAFSQVRTASNGQEALAIALEMKPDVVLCDVRMPKVNGIELARQLRLRFSDIHILFISAYSDKEYLKSAISLQADGYLEKPIDESELLDYLERTAKAIQNRRRIRRQQNNLAMLFARQQILRALLCRDDTQAEALALNPGLTRAVTGAGAYLPISIRMQWPGDITAMHYGFFSEVALAEMLSQISPNYLFAVLSESQLSVLLYGDAIPSPEDCRRHLLPLLDALGTQNPQALNVWACIGEPCGNCDALCAHYRAAHVQAQWMCFAGDPGCAVCSLPVQASPPEDRSARFEALLSNHQLDAAKELIRTQTEAIVRQGGGIVDQVRKYYELLLAICLRAGGSEQASLHNAQAGAEVMSAFSKLSRLTEMCRFICVRIDDIMPPISPSADQSRIIREVQDCIRQNLADSALSIQAIADRVGLSENYLSALYKRETGRTIHRVIVDLRIERAKYLLLNRHSVQEVARRCGFSSASYFHSVFKKQTGFSPAAFVERRRKNTHGDGD